MLSPRCSLASALLVLLASPATYADTVAVNLIAPNLPFFQTGSIGWQFQVAEPIRVTALGQHDLDGTTAGLLNPAQVGIFGADQSLLVSSVVPTGTGVELDGFFRFVDVSGPVLQPGSTYTVVSASRDQAILATPFATAGDPFPDIFEVDPIITTLGAMFENGPDFVFPTLGEGNSFLEPALYLGPNFRFVVIPEPSTALLFALGLIGLRGARKAYS